jgi:hypothetical protein
VGHKKSIVVVVALALLALASLGVGYGLWSKTLFINGVVQTGNVDAELSLEAVWDNEEIKDVGNCWATLENSTANGQANSLYIGVENAYPSYECWVEFDVHSTGSIPVHIYRPDWLDLPPENEVNVYVIEDMCYVDDTQLHQSDRAFCVIYIHVKQEAMQNAEYVFYGEIEARQFNEPRPPLE